MLYRELQEKDKTQSCKSNNKNTSKKFNNCIKKKKKKQNVQTIVLMKLRNKFVVLEMN